jgi:hypothetical protein
MVDLSAEQIEACRFVRQLYAEMGPLAPERFSREEQHALFVLSSYIESLARIDNTRPADDDVAGLVERLRSTVRAIEAAYEYPPGRRLRSIEGNVMNDAADELERLTRKASGDEVERVAEAIGRAVAEDSGRGFDSLWCDDIKFKPQMRVCARAALSVTPGRDEVIEMCAKVADDAADEAERIGKLHPEHSDSRGRMFARSREASAIAAAIRSLKDGGAA